MPNKQDRSNHKTLVCNISPITGKPHYPVAIVGTGITYDVSPQGELTNDAWRVLGLHLDDICVENLPSVPAQWQRKCVTTWQLHKRGGPAVLATLCELVANRLQSTPDDALHADIRLQAWLCGVTPAADVPQSLLEYQERARHEALHPHVPKSAWEGFTRMMESFFNPQRQDPVIFFS